MIKRSHFVVAFGVIFLLLPLVVTSPYIYSLLILGGIFSLLAIGLNLMFGYAGVISFGHAAFFGIGAYTAGIFTERLGWSLVASLPIVIIVAGLCGLILGLATIRIGGIYFAIASLGFAEIIRLIALNWTDLTNGPMGLVLEPSSLRLFGSIQMQGELIFYFLILAIVLLSLFFVHRIQQSWMGRALLSIRENEQLASSVGIAPTVFKLLVISLGGILAAVSGVFYVYYYGLVTPDVASVHYTTTALLAVLVGGRGTISGPLLGAAIFTLVPEFIPGALSSLIFGAIILIVVLLSPDGLVPIISRAFNKINKKSNRLEKKEKIESNA